MTKRLLFLLAALFISLPAHAQDASPGDACSTAGFFQRSGGPELSGAGHFMVCQGGTWKSVLSFNATGQITGASNDACTNGQVLKFNGSVFACADDIDTGLTSETDPEVGTLTSGKWCTTDGTDIDCTSDAPGGGSTSAFSLRNGSVSTSALSVITDFTQDYDPDTVWDESGSADRFQPTEAGAYYVFASGYWTSSGSASSKDAELQIRMNGTTILDYQTVSISTTSPTLGFSLSAHAVVYMNGTTDYIEFMASRSTGFSAPWSGIRAGGFAIGG